MKKLLITMLVCCVAFVQANAQGYTQGIPSEKVEKKAKKQTSYLSKELALTGKQEVLVQKKLTEFAMKRHTIIQADISKKDKTAQLKALKMNRLKEMRDILTQPQYDKYLKVLKQERRKNLMERKQKKASMMKRN